MKTNEKGFSVVEILIVVVIIGLVGAAGWLVYTRQPKHENKPVTAHSETKKENEPTASVKNPYEGMPQYTNDKYGISFYYPKVWTVDEVPIDDPSGIDPMEFSINILTNTTEKYAATAIIEVHTRSLPDTIKFYDKMYGQSTTATVSRLESRLKGKEAIHLTSTYPDSSKTEHYFFAVGDKTYSLRSINESLNIQRSQDYWGNFQKIYDSLQLK